MNRYGLFTLLLLSVPVGAWAQAWCMLLPKAVLTNDVQQFYIGTCTPPDPHGRASANETANPNLPIQLFINGQPNRPDQLDPYGAVLTGTFYDRFAHQMIRKFFYEAPAKMPDKNPVEIKAIITPATGLPITVTFTVIVLAESWTFTHFHGIHYRCYEGGSANPKNAVMADMGMATQMEQAFHFTASTLNFLTGEATAIPDGDPTVVYTKAYTGGACYPAAYTAKLQWGDDDQTLIRDVKARFTGDRIAIDYKIDYMNYLGWNSILNATGTTIFTLVRKPGKHDATAHVESPLQRKFISQYTTPPDQQISLHSGGGVQIKAKD